jgi:hypothetical protein
MNNAVKWHDTHTKFYEYDRRFRHSDNIIVSTIWEAALLVLLTETFIYDIEMASDDIYKYQVS